MLSSNKIITKSREYEFLHPWLNTGLLTSTGWEIYVFMVAITVYIMVVYLVTQEANGKVVVNC